MAHKPAFYISLFAIGIYWVLSVLTPRSIPPPQDTIPLLLDIVSGKIFLLIVFYVLLRWEGDDFKDLGFTSPGWMRQLSYGLLFGMVIWIFIHLMLNPVVKSLLPENEALRTNMAVYFRDFNNMLLWIPVAIFGGGFVEEFHRIFALTRFKKLMGQPGLIVCLLVSTIFFGIAHLYQGPNSAIAAGASGLLFGLVYLRRGNALEAVAAHSIYDVIGIIVGHLMSRG